MSKYSFSSTDSAVEEFRPMLTVKVPRSGVSYTDTESKPSRRSSTLFMLNKLTTGLNWDFSTVAFENAIFLFKMATKAQLRPLVIDNLEGDEGVFMDFTKGHNYYAFELFNDGEIVMTSKVGDQDSVVAAININQITL